jgi:hypothetical protein
MQFVAVRQHAARDFPRQRTRDERRRERHREIERLAAAAFAQGQDVPMTRRHDQRGARRIAGNDRVNRVRSAVNEHLAALQHRGAIEIETVGGNLQRLEHAFDGVGRRSWRLEHVKAAVIILDD